MDGVCGAHDCDGDFVSNQLYLPLPTPVTQPSGIVTVPWQLLFQALVQGVNAAGNVTGPASSTNGFPALWDGTAGQLLKNSAPLAGTKVYYVSDTSGGAVTRKLTFTNGLLTAET